jgi:hypothetical protein
MKLTLLRSHRKILKINDKGSIEYSYIYRIMIYTLFGVELYRNFSIGVQSYICSPFIYAYACKIKADKS